MGVLLQYTSVVSFTAWGLYLWVHVKDFGSQPECNHQIKYVLFFVTVRATAPWLRGLWIAALVFSAVVLMVFFGLMAWTLFSMKRMERAELKGTMLARRSTLTAEASEKAWYRSANFPLLG
jgi:glucan phosphoethanolaminetransferase (alkaline phosphatase superfamily)